MFRCQCKWLALALVAGGLFWAFDFAVAGGDKGTKAGDAAKKFDDAKKKAAEAKQKAEEALKEANRLADEAKKAEDAAKASANKSDDTKKKVDTTKKSDEAKKTDDTKKAEAARKADEAKKAEATRRADETKKADEARKLDEARRAEAKKKSDEANLKRAEETAKRKADEDAAKKKAELAKTLDDLPKDKEGFSLLLSGKDLANWYLGNDSRATLEGKSETDGKFFHATNNVLVVEVGDSKKNHHQTLRNVKLIGKRFQTKFEYRADKDSKANINLGGYGISLRDYSKSFNRPKFNSYKVGDWNTIEVSIEPGTYTASLDNKMLTDKDTVEFAMKDGKPAVKINGKSVEPGAFQLVRSSPIVIVKCNGEELEKGHFHVQGHGPLNGQISIRADLGKVELRNLRVRELN